MYNQMVVHNLTNEEMDLLFHALADATRRDIIARVTEREQSVSALAQQYLISFAAVQKHVAVLEKATLVVKHRKGREQIVHGNPEALRKAARLLDEYEQLWAGRVSRITKILAED